MRAVLFRTFGPPYVLEVVQDFPKPSQVAGEALVRVCATSVNPIDWKMRGGQLPKFLVKLPKIPGADVSGVVEKAAPGGKFKEGDRVFGFSGVPWNQYGSYAQFFSLPDTSLAFVPDGVDHEHAAAVPLAASTAWQALSPTMPLEGKRVLIHAGAGGVGGAAVQIAKAQGAHVTTTCSERNVQFVTQELGADVAVDYKLQRFEEVAPGLYDIVVDTIGGDYEARSLRLLKKDGHYVNLNGPSGLNSVTGAVATIVRTARVLLLSVLRMGPRYHMVIASNRADRGLEQVARLMREGKFRVFIDKVLPLESAKEAHEYGETHRTRGKVVLKVAQS